MPNCHVGYARMVVDHRIKNQPELRSEKKNPVVWVFFSSKGPLVDSEII